MILLTIFYYPKISLIAARFKFLSLCYNLNKYLKGEWGGFDC